jgi:hypothetical protein
MTTGFLPVPGLTVRRTDMWSLGKPRRTCVALVSLLLFATSIGHTRISGEAKSHIKNLLYSPPVTIDECDHFLARTQANNQSLVSGCYCEHAEWYGRLGNSISLASKLISESESYGCGVRLREDMLSGWDPSETEWDWVRLSEMNNNISMTKNDTCGSRTGNEWYFLHSRHSPKCHLQLLRRYFNINRTHTLGKTCSSVFGATEKVT